MADPIILIIDDEDDIRTEMVELFDLVGYPAIGASGILEGIAHLRRYPTLRAAICDLRLRGESGLGLVAHIAEAADLAARRLGLMFLTGDPAQAATVAPGAAQIMMKPVDPQTLIRAAAKLMAETP